jgi:CHAD domain-containing protein
MKAKPFDLSITLGEYGYQIIRQNFQGFVEQEKDVLKDKDPEPLHQMRVGMRRLRTAIQVFSPAIALPEVVGNVAIGKIAKGLGKTRDLDVLQQELITHYQPLLQKSERSKFNEVLEQVQQQRHHNFLQFKNIMKGDRYHQLKQAIQSWLDHPAYKPMGNLLVLQVLPDLLLPLICSLLLHPGWLVGTTAHAGCITLMPFEDSEGLNQQLEGSSGILHDLRKRIKGVRYQTEFFSDFYEASYVQKIEEFKAIQDILGQLQDQAVLHQFLEDTLRSNVAQVLPSIAHQIQQDQSTFWQRWQPLQQQYLDSEFRRSLRSLLTTPIEQTPTLLSQSNFSQ